MSYDTPTPTDTPEPTPTPTDTPTPTSERAALEAYDLKTAATLIGSKFNYLLDAVKSNMPATRSTGVGRDRRYYVSSHWLTQYVLYNVKSVNLLSWFDTSEFRAWAQANAQAVDMIRATLIGLISKSDELQAANAKFEAEGLNRITRETHMTHSASISKLDAAIAKLLAVIEALSAAPASGAESASPAAKNPVQTNRAIAEAHRALRQAERDEDEREASMIEAEIARLSAPPAIAPISPAPAADLYAEARAQRAEILHGLVMVVAEYDMAQLVSANMIWQGKVGWDDSRSLYRVGQLIVESAQGEFSGAPTVWASPDVGLPGPKPSFF